MSKPFEMTNSMRRGGAMIKAVAKLGLPLGPLVILSVRGRKTGIAYSTPVAVVDQDGARWLVAAFGEVGWVRNLRAGGEALLLRGRRSEHIRAAEVPPSEAAPVLRSFLRKFRVVPFFQPYFKATAQSPLADFEREALDHPVFRIVSS